MASAAPGMLFQFLTSFSLIPLRLGAACASRRNSFISRRSNMKTVRLIVPVTALLIFTFGWDSQTNVFAEQSRPLTAAEKKDKGV